MTLVAHTPAPAKRTDEKEEDVAASARTVATSAETTSRRRSSVTIDKAVAIGLTDLTVSLAGGIGHLAIGHRLDGYLSAFRAIRPLVVQLLVLPPRKAYRSFKLYSRLQRLCQVPYLPDTTEMKVCNDQSRHLSRYVKFAVGAYPVSALLAHNIDVKGLSEKAPLDAYIGKLFPRAKLILKREKAEFEKPAFMLWILDKEIILSIQGTTSKIDWVTNLVCNPSHLNGAHLGMRKSAVNLDYEIRQTILNHCQAHVSWKVTLVGHSLGGGVATLLAIRWINLLPVVHRSQVQAYSFGSPCVVSGPDAMRYRSQIFSIIYGRDLVTRLSFGAVRDMLITLHGMCVMAKNASDTCLKDLHGEEGLMIDDASSDNSDGDVDALENDDMVPVLTDEDWTEDDSGALCEDGVYCPKMSGHSRRELLRRDLSIYNSDSLSLPINFNELCRLARHRAWENETRINKYKVCPKKKSWISKILYVCSGSVTNGESLTDLQRANELTMMHDALQRIMAIHTSPIEEMLVPAGSATIIVPKLHFLVAKQKAPATFNKGQCVLFQTEGRPFIETLRHPVWHMDALQDHAVDCYYQGLCCEELVKLPAHTAVLPSQLQTDAIPTTTVAV